MRKSEIQHYRHSMGPWQRMLLGLLLLLFYTGSAARAGFVLDENNLSQRGRRWPQGIIPFKISPSFPQAEADRIRKVIGDYNSRTVLKWTDWNGEKDYVEFTVKAGGAPGSALGMQKGRQEIMIGDREGAGTVAHEMGHTIGLLHEETRPDIALHLKFIGDMNNERDALCHSIFFERTNPNGLIKYSEYDHISVMRMNNWCTIGGVAVVLPVNPPPPLPADWNWDEKFLSPGDVKNINAYYLDENRNFPDPSSSLCKDFMGCQSFKDNGNCENYSMQIVAYSSCAKTCQLCKTSAEIYLPPGSGDNGDPGPAQCGNTRPAPFCNLGSTMDMCRDPYSAFMRDCSKSCGQCEGFPRVREMVDQNGHKDNPWCGGWVHYDTCTMPFVREQCPVSCALWNQYRSLYGSYGLEGIKP